MWGLIFSFIAFLALGLRECPSLDPRENMARAANVPIEIWIELRDQHDVPLRNHPVTVSLWHWRNDSQEAAELRETDNEGRLHIVGRHHCGVTLALDKELYQETHMMPWWYTSTLVTGVRREMIRDDWGTAEQPTICRVLRKEGPQPLTEVWGRVYFPSRTETIYIDLKRAIITGNPEGADFSLDIDLGDEIQPYPENRRLPDGAVYYPKLRMFLRPINGWVDRLPRSSDWYRRFVHAALAYRPSDVLIPLSGTMVEHGAFSEEYFLFSTADGSRHGKAVIAVNPGKGPAQDPCIQIRMLINESGSKSFEYEPGTITTRQLAAAPDLVDEDYVPNVGTSPPVAWENVYPQAALATKPAP